MRSKHAVCAAVFAALMCGTAMAEEHVVKAVITNWEPMVTYAKPGDTVKFIQMTGHDTEAIEGMMPEGAKGWKAKLGQEGFSVTLDKEGAYIYKCNPHITTGMVGAIVVGDGAPSNLDALDAALPKVKLGKNMVARTIKKMKEDLKKTGHLKQASELKGANHERSLAARTPRRSS